MKIYTGGKDISNLLKAVTWSGDSRQVARVLSFSILKNVGDSHLPIVSISEGDDVFLLTEAGKYLFSGIIISIDSTSSSKIVSYMAKDLMFYLNGSELTKDFFGTAEEISGMVCEMLQIPAGVFAKTGILISNPCIRKTGYQIIQSSYTAAARQNGKKYMPMVTELNRISVIEKGKLCGVSLDANANLTEVSFKSTLENLVNRVLITDKKGAVLKTIEDGESRTKYGTIQKILEQGDKEDKTSEAHKMLKNAEYSATVSGYPDDVRALSGYSVLVSDAQTGLVGQFYIASDSHHYEDGKEEMTLTLEFENMMDEQELGKEAKNGGIS